jgi:hypothetical protein
MKKKSLYNFIKYFDQFGYRINLNFKREGEIVKTNIGGIISILISSFLFIFTILKINSMLLK